MLFVFCLGIVLTQGVIPPPAPAFSPQDPNSSPPLAASELQALLEAEAKTWNVPGAGMVAVYPGATQTRFVTGVRSLEGKEPVGDHTVFPSGSLTKAFTTALAAIAVARGQWSWDDPVHKYFADFPDSLDSDPGVALKLWHLGSHTSGYPSHDLLFYRQDQPIREGVKRLLSLPAVWRPGTHYQYQNLMVRSLGLALENKTGQNWSELVRKELLQPLGMTGESFTAQEFQAGAERALPHRLDDASQPAQWKEAWLCRNEDPCASLCLPLKAWEPWLRLHLGQKLDKGPEPREIKQILETHATRIMQPDGIQDREFQPEFAHLGYGLGWVTLKYRGDNALAHGGVMDGYRAFILLIPDRQVGVVVFANLDRTPMCHALACKALDLILQAPRVDWTGRMLKKKVREDREKKEVQDRVARAARAWKGAEASRQWPGDYHNAAYGRVRFQVTNDQASLEFRGQKYPVVRIDAGQFFLFDPVLGDAEVTLSRVPGGIRLRIAGRMGAEFVKTD